VIKRAGIKTSALICPVVPYITDAKSLVDALAPLPIRFWVYGLSIQRRLTENWRNIDNLLKNRFPRLKEKIEARICKRWRGIKIED
jgi:DNA repair photolyase